MLSRMPPRPVASQVTHVKGEAKYFLGVGQVQLNPQKILRGKVFKDRHDAVKGKSMFL